MGPAPAAGDEDPDLINAGKQPVTLLPGGAYFHHADSFAMMRGGHLDFCVLGAFQVSARGDLANWHTGAKDAIPAVGGAMDLALGAKQVFVMMEHLTKSGESKIVAALHLSGDRPRAASIASTPTSPSSTSRPRGPAWSLEIVDGLAIRRARAADRRAAQDGTAARVTA